MTASRALRDRVHELVALRIYARNARGLVRFGLREVIKPLLPEPLRSSPRSPFPRHCHRADLVLLSLAAMLGGLRDRPHARRMAQEARGHAERAHAEVGIRRAEALLRRLTH